jgi:hypothetical protein
MASNIAGLRVESYVANDPIAAYRKPIAAYRKPIAAYRKSV